MDWKHEFDLVAGSGTYAVLVAQSDGQFHAAFDHLDEGRVLGAPGQSEARTVIRERRTADTEEEALAELLALAKKILGNGNVQLSRRT